MTILEHYSIVDSVLAVLLTKSLYDLKDFKLYKQIDMQYNCYNHLGQLVQGIGLLKARGLRGKVHD